MKISLIRLFWFTCLLANLLMPSLSQAQAYSARPVQLIVPYAPGGSSDVIARTLAPYLSQELGISIVISNRGGANTAVGASFLAHVPADGDTLMLADVALILNTAIHGSSSGYDPIKDFKPAVMLGSAPFVLFVPASNSSKLSEFLVKGKSGTITIANSGPGSLGHLGAELLGLRTGLKIISVPYKGAGPAMTDTLSGHVDAIFGSTASGMPLVKNNQLRALAVAAPKRLTEFPDLPTFDEFGIGGVHVLNWWGIIGPAGLSQDKSDRLYKALHKVAAQPEVQARLAALGITPTLLGSEAFSAEMKNDLNLWRRVVTDGKIKIE
jgi:hypothetical protein